MKRRIVAGLAVLFLGFVAYSFYQFRVELHKVYVVPDPYAIFTTSDTDLIVVEFIDYSCIHCQKLHPVLKAAIEKDGRIRYIPRPLVSEKTPITKDVVSFLYASAWQVSLPKVHDKIFELWPIENMDVLFEYAESIQMDTEKLRKDMEDPITQEAVDLNRYYFDQWRIGSVPLILVATPAMGTKAIYVPDPEHEVTVDEFVEKFKELRSWF